MTAARNSRQLDHARPDPFGRHQAMVGGKPQGQNLIKTVPDQDPWSTAQTVRYPSRRTFREPLADTSYAAYEPYKFMPTRSTSCRSPATR